MPTTTKEEITLKNLNDYQKSLLTRLPYLDINMTKFEELKLSNKHITVSSLASILSNPDLPYMGDMNISGSAKYVTGVDTSNSSLLRQICSSRMANLMILEIIDDPKTGFHAICFSDYLFNKGFSFRGTDLKNISSFVKDGYTDLESFLTNDTLQLIQANELFNEFSNKYGKNYLYGHSLGGFLAENIYCNNYKNIENLYVINPLHINQEQLNSQDKIDAFNDSKKFSCFVTGGDYVSPINSSELFKNNIQYIQNSNITKNNVLGNHLIESALFDKYGNFITQSKESCYKGYESSFATKAISIINNKRVKSFFNKNLLFTKKAIVTLKSCVKLTKNSVINVSRNIKFKLSNIFNNNFFKKK